MKKILALALALILVVGMVGCAAPAAPAETDTKTEAPAKEEAPAEETPAEETPAEETPAADDDVKVGVCMKTLDGSFFVAMVDMFVQAGEARGWEVNVLNSESDTSKEAANMDTFIAQDYDLIFIDPYDTEGCVAAINKAFEAGIPVIAVDNSAGETANVSSIVYPDNLENGRMVGKWTAETQFAADEPIISICIGGQKGLEAARERRVGVICGVLQGRLGLTDEEAWALATPMEQEMIDTGKAYNEEANFEIRGIGWGAYAYLGGLEAAEDLLVGNEDVNFMFAENDAMLLGALTALESSGMTDQVVIAGAADGQKEALELIKAGTKYVATGNNKPGATVDAAMGIAIEIIENGADPLSFDRVTLTNPACINPDNVDEFYDAASPF